jgi:nucleotide-binding universal stress UspA family protein
MQKITAYLDGSVYAESVCDHAVWAAERLKMPIQLVHVLGRRSDMSSQPAVLSGSLRLGARSSLLEELARHDEERARLTRARGRALLDDATARIISRGDVEVSANLRIGDFVEAIGAMEEETRFAIIGKRGEAADFATMHLGSNLDRAVRAANRPVLVASRAFRPIRRFLLADDGSPSARRALERLREGSVLDGLECHILTASNDPAARAAVETAAGILRGAGFEVTEHVARGEPEKVISEAVTGLGIDLLVLGKSGNSRLRRLFIGSTTLELMRNCTVPVLIFP